MPRDNGFVKFDGAELINALNEVEYMLISLRDIGNYYYRDIAPLDEITQIAYAVETSRFLTDSKIDQRLENIKNTLLRPLIIEPGTNEGARIKKALGKVKCWERPGD